MDAQVFRILEKLFSDIDSYSPECQEGTETAFEISEPELRRQAAKALSDLRRLGNNRPVLEP
jgi:Bacterial self-protective colicin-like immunity